jgi:hypothetical protein
MTLTTEVVLSFDCTSNAFDIGMVVQQYPRRLNLCIRSLVAAPLLISVLTSSMSLTHTSISSYPGSLLTVAAIWPVPPAFKTCLHPGGRLFRAHRVAPHLGVKFFLTTNPRRVPKLAPILQPLCREDG